MISSNTQFEGGILVEIGVEQVKSGVEQIQSGVGQVKDGIEQVQDGVDKINRVRSPTVL